MTDSQTAPFHLDAGRPCLDFANTWSSTSGEHLNRYDDLVDFADQSHLITPAHARWLHDESRREQATATAVLARARRLRDALRAIFASIAAANTPANDELSVLNLDLAASLGHARLISDGHDGFIWGWSDTLTLNTPLWPIVRSAADVLTTEQERRLVRECGADDCAWLFLDMTRNRSRQWCSMASCGNREKARRHYQRQRARRQSA